MSKREQALIERVIPLPKTVQIPVVRRLEPSGCSVAADSTEATVHAAVEVLLAAIPGARESSQGNFLLRLAVLPGDALLAPLPNSDQAYAIRPLSGEQSGLELAGTTGVGVLNAARTLAQLVRLAPPHVEMPIATILDWPDLAERGQWGGDVVAQLANTAALKMNLLELGVVPKLDEQGRVGLSLLTPRIHEQAHALGVKTVIYVPHLGDLGKYSNLFERRPELMSTPNPDEPLPADYKPSVCFSKPGSATLLAELMTEAIRVFGECGREMNVWLTEEGTPCFCDQCRGHNPYVLETRLLAKAYRIVKQDHPEFTLRILLTQGSYDVNDQILAAVPDDAGVTFYSGTHTYDSSQRPMIYRLLETYAREHWLGVVPQLDNSWRTVFPFTGPQFIRARMREFASKRLQSVTGYATPSNRFCAFNVAGLAEWAWNAEGRSEHDFARAWALRQGMKDPEGFADWACLIGLLGWDLAGGRFPMRLFWDPARSILEKPAPMVYGDGLLAEIPSAEHLTTDIALARKALAMARRLAQPDCIAESQVVLNSHLFLQALVAISHLPRLADNAVLLAAHLADLDVAAERAVKALWAWGSAVYAEMEQKPPHRFEETLSVFLQVVTEAYRLAAECYVVDPRPAHRDRRIGRWSEADFAGRTATFRLDVTEIAAGPGLYRVMFRFLGGGYGVDINRIIVRRVRGHKTKTLLSVEPRSFGYGDTPVTHIGRYEAWNDVRIKLPALRTGDRCELEIELGGLPMPGEVPAERRTTSGEICLRKAWA